MHYHVIQLAKRKTLIALLIVAAIAFIPAVAHASEEPSLETAVDNIADSSSANSSTAATEASAASDSAGSEQHFDSITSDTALQESESATDNLAPEEDNSSAPFAGDIVAAPEGSPEGNSYKAEIEVADGPPHIKPGETKDIKVTFTELGESTLLGSARVDLAAGFDYSGYESGSSAGLTVNSSHGAGVVASRWNAVWQDVSSILLTADDASGYLAKDGWVSVLFNAKAPVTEGEHTFATTAWTDHTQTTTNNMHPDYRNPTIVVSEQVSYRIIENILTDVEIEQILEDNSRVAVPNPMPHPEDELLDLEISYQFTLPEGHQYGAGAFFEFTLPGEFAVHNAVGPYALVDSEATIFGQYQLSTDRKVKLTFNSEIETYVASGLLGWVSFQTEVREDLDGDLQREIIINIRDNSPVKIPLNFEAKAGSSIDKRGVPNRGETANQTYNADSITWTVDFNKDLQTIENAVLRDPLGANLTLVGNSIELYLLRVQLDGSVIQEAAVLVEDYEIVTSAIESEDKWFEIRFNSEISDAYRLVFRTGIDQDGFEYTNTATLTGSNITPPLVAAATVSVDRGAVIEKVVVPLGYNQNLQTVDWEIRINYNLKTIAADQSTVTDTYGTAQSLVDGSLQVRLVTLDANGVETGAVLVDAAEYNVAELKDTDDKVIGFTVTFNDNIISAYRINYQTKPVERVYDTVTLINTAQFSGESDGASQQLSQSILSKTHQDVNYTDKTVQWTIVINRDQQPMDNLHITDIFTNRGLTITPGDPNDPADLRSAVAVTGLPVGVTYDIALLAEGEGFIIDNFRDGSNNPVTISDTITITYTTVFAFDELTTPSDYFRNNVSLDWLDANGRERYIDDTEIFEPNQQTRQNGYKGGSYNALTKEITWTVGVNYNLREVNDAQVLDYILGNQSLVNGSIDVYSATIEENGTVTRGAAMVEGSGVGQYQLDLTVTGPEPETNPGFRISLGNIDSLYIIVYRTSLVERVIAGRYDNTAYLYSGETQQAVLNATVSNSNWGIYTKKQGDNEGRTVTWQIDINPGLSQLTGVQIEDILSPGQRILQDSIKVYATTVTGANGSYERAAELVRDTDYTVAFSGNLNNGESMKLSLIGENHSTINSAYIVEYETFIEFVFQGQVSNSVVLTATTTGLPNDTGDSEDIGGRITSGQGGISGFLGRLVVRKTDISTGGLLPGAQFELRHTSGDTVIATATSGPNGTAVFNNVLFGNYSVTETVPPAGYALDNPAPRAVTLSSSSATLTFSNTQLPDEDGDDDTSTGDDPDPGSDRGSISPGIWNVLSSGIQGLSVAKKADAEAQLSGNARELPRTEGTGIYQILIISGLALTAGYFAYKRSFKIKQKVT